MPAKDKKAPAKDKANKVRKDEEKIKKKESKQNKKEAAAQGANEGCICRRTVDMDRVAALARPNARRLRSLWDENAAMMPKERRDKIKSALEEDYFLSPEQTEQYFQALTEASRRIPYGGGLAGYGGGLQPLSAKENAARQRELQQRQKWLVNFSAQVAYRMCDYIAKGQREMLVSNRLRSIADVVLERVAEILGEPKPTRTHPGRLARFMVAISDRIAVWIENSVYRADARDYEPYQPGKDKHIRLDNEEPVICDY
ncbi:hypothetical protein O0L34_g13938 [Tuta absoluta]|nr:hypothetical protein O0L34_g13938 [Tuta absoluta]